MNAPAHIQRVKTLIIRLPALKVDAVVLSLKTVWTLDLDGVDALHSIVELFDNVRMLLQIVLDKYM